ncbi:hypothetical protein FBY22_3561 [Streptomyces sp. SLBN-31]|nr:hypothetical protein FBY22_3561 [Streptomyces sp. SLBN-31]
MPTVGRFASDRRRGGTAGSPGRRGSAERWGRARNLRPSLCQQPPVGVDRIGTEGAFRALRWKEQMVARSEVPYSIIRSTQVFETVDDVAEAATEDWIVWLPPVRTRPVAGEEVATLLAHTAAFSPLQGVKEIAGPRQFRLDTFVRQALTAEHEHRQVFTDWRSTFLGSRVRRDDLLPGPDAYIAQRLYGEWLMDRMAEGHRAS